jgi:small subunit ribosomal protein S10e
LLIFSTALEGVLVAKKDFNAPKHEDLDVPNLEVIKGMQSLTSKGFVKTRFSWQYYYYTLTDEGLDYLREWCVFWIIDSIHHSLLSITCLPLIIRLNLPTEIVPATHKKAARAPRPATVRPGGDGVYRPPRGDRDDYRRRDEGGDKEGAPSGFRPRYAGVGRGAPQAPQE